MSVPAGIRGHHPVPDHPEMIPVPAEVFTEALGPRVPLMSHSPKQWIAASGMILRVKVGSEVYGTALESGDQDEMGICIEPPTHVVGNLRFDRYQYRTAEPDGPLEPGHHACSGPGDLDLTVHGLRHYASLAAAGNPSMLVPLFVPEDAILYATDIGRELLANRHWFVSRAAAPKFAGYLRRQREGVEGKRSNGARNMGRRDLRERHGWDTKFGMHMIRLGLQGVELLTTGEMALPMRAHRRSQLLDIRRGELSKDEAIDWANDLERQILALETTSRLPADPDWASINSWLIGAHLRKWGYGR